MTLEPVVDDGRVVLHHGDCVEVLRELPDASVDAVVTDPPYALNFMGRAWDRFQGVATGACEECGNDDPAEGYRLCTDCMDKLTARDSTMLGEVAQNYHGKGAHTRGYADNNNAAFQRWCVLWARESLRILKPGGHILAFGGSRTWHRLACAIEDAGFEIRDSIAWIYGSGFPKSRDVTEAMQKWIDGERERWQANPAGIREGVYEVTAFLKAARDKAGWTNRQIDELFGTAGMAGHWTTQASQPAVPSLRQWALLKENLGFGGDVDHLVAGLASTERGEDWGTGGSSETFLAGLGGGIRRDTTQAWGTALKPAFEPIVVGRKRFPGTVAACVQTNGTGALNIEGCRTPMSDEDRVKFARGAEAWAAMSERRGQTLASGEPRKPSNIYGDYGTFVKGEAEDGGRWPANVVLDESQAAELDKKTNEAGGTSRYFYVPKAHRSERVNIDGVLHPTVKPLDLMRWLVRLVTPPGGTVLEPFAGSGTTVEACLLEGFGCVAIEREGDYLPLIVQRLNRRQDPVKAVKAAGGDAGLFDLLDADA